MKIEFVKYNKIYLMITLALVTLAIVAIGIWGLKLGIDFSGGTIIEYNITGKPDTKDVQTKLQNTEKKVSKIVLSGKTYLLYFEPLKDTERDAIEAEIVKAYPASTRVAVETISSTVGLEQSKSALLSILFASIGIIIFLTISFKKVTAPFKSWEFGVSAVLALLHDAIIVLGAFAILGHFFGAEIDLLFITAILTVIGFSVHDTIVVFDRIRENILKYGSLDYKKVINNSLVETLARSINLTVTTLLVLLALFVLGPESLRWFLAALIIGMFSGTYSSIFVASQILILFQPIKEKLGRMKLFKKK